MHIDVNGTRLWFDVDGPALVPDGSEMRQRPTVVLVHGGPGSFDHSYFKPDFARLAEHAQVVYLDLRGHGRSDWGDAAAWSFEDLRGRRPRLLRRDRHRQTDRPRALDGRTDRPALRRAPSRTCGWAGCPVGVRAVGRAAAGRGVSPRRGRRGGGDRGAQLRRRGGARRGVGPRLCRLRPTPARTKSERLARPRISSSTRTAWSSSADSTSSISSAVSTSPTLVSRRRARPGHTGRRRRRDRRRPARRHRAARGDRRSWPLHVDGRSGPLLADDHRVRRQHDRTRTRRDVSPRRQHLRGRRRRPFDNNAGVRKTIAPNMPRDAGPRVVWLHRA